MSRLVRAIIYIAVIALVLVVVAPKVFADEPEVPIGEAEGGGQVVDMSADWFFDTATGVQYEGVAEGTRCWEPDGTQGTTRLDPLTCETPAEAEYAKWVEESTEPLLEEGATFDHDNGICWEADGTEGIITFDYQCMTPSDYDAIFSYENLATVPACPQQHNDCTLEDAPSIAEIYDISPEGDASDRPIGTGLVEPGTETSFKEKVAAAHVQSPHMPIAD